MPGPELAEPPDHGINAGNPADINNAEAVEFEKQREQHPDQSVRNLVGDTALAKRPVGPILKGNLQESAKHTLCGYRCRGSRLLLYMLGTYPVNGVFYPQQQHQRQRNDH